MTQLPEIPATGLSYSKLLPEVLGRPVLYASKDVIFLVDSELRITYCNPAWDTFAMANGGEGVLAEHVIGSNLMSAIAEPLHPLFRDVCRSCREHHLTFDMDYECSTAALYRLLHVKILPLRASGELAFIHSTRVERPHGVERPAFSATSDYVGDHGIVTLCCHCRRARRQDASSMWDWVPAFLQPERWKITHGMCPVCVSYFYSRYLVDEALQVAAS
jgi:hypothetical protein